MMVLGLICFVCACGWSCGTFIVFDADDAKYAGKFVVEAPLKNLPEPALKVGGPDYTFSVHFVDNYLNCCRPPPDSIIS